jgi:hypothetical protein
MASTVAANFIILLVQMREKQMIQRTSVNVVMAILLSAVSVLHAQDAVPFQGWDRNWKLGSNLSFNDNRSVIGKPEGMLTTFGFQSDAGISFLQGQHEWKNTLNLKLTFSRDPVVKEFTKPADALTFDSIYLYTLPEIPWLGFFGRGGLETSIFKGFDVQPEEKTYEIRRRSGAIENKTAKSLDLTDPLKPLTLKESLGVFARPFQQPKAQLEIKTGAGARQTFARSQFIVRDDAATGLIEVEELKNLYQLGSEVSAELKGDPTPLIEYRFFGEVLTPFVTNKASGDNRNPWELSNMEFAALANLKIASWATLSYEYKATKTPQLLDKFQFSQALLLNFGYEVFKPRNAR